MRSGVERFGAALAQISFAAAQQLAPDAATLEVGSNPEDADNAGAQGVSLDQGGMSKAEAAIVFLGENQTSGIENGLGEYETFEG